MKESFAKLHKVLLPVNTPEDTTPAPAPEAPEAEAPSAPAAAAPRISSLTLRRNPAARAATVTIRVDGPWVRQVAVALASRQPVADLAGRQLRAELAGRDTVAVLTSRHVRADGPET